MIVGGRKKAVPLKVASRQREFKALEITPEMRAAYDRCEGPKQISLEAETTVPLKREVARISEMSETRRKR